MSYYVQVCSKLNSGSRGCLDVRGTLVMRPHIIYRIFLHLVRENATLFI